MKSRIFILCLATFAALGFTSQTALADPIDLSPEAPPRYVFRIENAADYLMFSLYCADMRYELQYGCPWYHADGPIVALATELYDSLKAASAQDSLHFDGIITGFIHTDSRVLRAAWIPPAQPEHAIWIGRNRCSAVEDVCRITRLDSTQFVVTPIKVIYRFGNGTIQERPYEDPAVRPEPFGVIRKSGFYSLLSALSLVAFMLSVVLPKRKRQRYL
jgi:hypothetical protein